LPLISINSNSTSGESIVTLHELHAFVVRCLKAVGISEEHESTLASADYRGHYSHGLNRLGES
jgi:LDH2 family malate/lactate/ureidoglycolate dehydrogenase